MLGKIESKRRKGEEMVKIASLTQWAWIWATPEIMEDRGAVVLQFMGSQRAGHDLVNKNNKFTET